MWPFILVILLQNSSLLKKADEMRVGEWAKFIWEYSTPVDRANFNEGNFLEHLLAIKVNMERLPWGKNLTKELIYHYVIPPRVSQEPLENFTWLYRDTLYNLVKDCSSIEEAILKVNEWCFIHMEYKPTDPWDQPATATLKRGFGRCEEMTILFMKALRTVAIPVRYVYTPWWPFTESNHAWVEVWTEKGWKFLGSAEPTDLNFAWFREPSKKAGIVLAVTFGNIKGSTDEIIRRYRNYTVLNVTKNYTNPFVLKVKVFDSNRLAKDVSFSINVWNYSAFVPVWACSLSKGVGSFTLGRTDFLIYAQKGDKRAFYFLRPTRDTVEVKLKLGKNLELDTLFTMRAARTLPDTERPKYSPDLEHLQQARAEYFEKLEFPFRDSINDTILIKIFTESRGNWPALWNFYKNHGNLASVFKVYLSRFESKDLVMLDTVGLCDELCYMDSALKLSKAPQVLVDSFVIPPRIYYEEFGFYRKALYSRFKAMYDGESFDSKLLSWVKKNIRRVNSKEFYKPFQSPVQTLLLKQGSDREIYVFISAVFRTFGIPAKLTDDLNGVQYYVNGWKVFTFEGKTPKKLETGKIKLTFYRDGIDVTKELQYYYNFSIQKFKDYPVRLDVEGSYEDSAVVFELAPGEYYLMYGFRNALGDVFGKSRKFKVKKDSTQSIFLDVSFPVEWLKEGDLVVRNVNLDRLKELLRGYELQKGNYLIAWVNLASEASKSSLNSAVTELRNFTGRLVIMTSDTLSAISYLKDKNLYGDVFKIDSEELSKAGFMKEPSFILLLNGRVAFFVEGLTLNLGDLIRKFTPR